jgi:hypothetical protein
MIQNKSHTLRNQLFVVLLTGTITVLMFALTLLILPKTADGIPWTQEMQRTPTPFQDLLYRFLSAFLVVTATNVLIWGYFRLRKIQKLSLLVLTMIIASAGCLVFSTLPVAYDAVWSIIIKLHLKQPEQYLDLVANVLYSVLTVGIGASMGLLLLSLVTVASRKSAK